VTKRSFEFGQASAKAEANQLSLLPPVDVHLIILVKDDKAPVVRSVISRRQAQAVRHIIRATLSSDRDNVCGVDQLQL